MNRDREELTRPDIFDTMIPPDDEGAPDHHAAPIAAIPDHGRRPRPKRPSAAAYGKDRVNLYRPANDPYPHERPRRDDDLPPSSQSLPAKQKQAIQMLTQTAKEEAPKLAWRSDTFVAQMIEAEVMPAARKIVNKNLPTAARSTVLKQFRRVLREEIRLAREKLNITKT